jgi:hypothetical protein
LNEIQQLEIVIDDWICFGPKRNIFDCYWCFPRYQDAEFLMKIILSIGFACYLKAKDLYFQYDAFERGTQS